MDVNLAQLEDFVVIAAERHFGRAAARRNLSASALSKRMRRLEHEVGARLVDRDGGGFIDLTPAGRCFLPRAEALLRTADRARREALGAPGTAVVRLGIPGAPTDHLSPGAWRALCASVATTSPRCQVSAVGVPYGRLTQSVLAGHVDVLLTTGDLDRPGLDTVPLTAVDRVCLLPSDHPLAEAAAVTVADVVDLPMIVEPTAAPQWMSPWVLGDVRGRRDMRLTEVRAHTLADVADTVRSGAAVTLATSTLVPLLPAGLSAPVVADAPRIEIAALHRTGDDRDEVLALLDVLRILSPVLGCGRR